MEFIKLRGSSVKIFLFIVGWSIYSNTALAFQSEGLFQEVEGYYVDMKGDTSFTIFKIRMYLEEPDYIILQYGMKCFDKTGNVKKLTSKNTKSYGFTFHHQMIRMVSFKNKPVKNSFTRLLNKEDYKLQDADFKLYVNYRFYNPIISSLLKLPLTKEYFYQQGDSRLYHLRNKSILEKQGNN